MGVEQLWNLVAGRYSSEKEPGLCGVGTVVESGCRVVQERAGMVGSWYICGIQLQDGTGERARPLWS